MRIPRATYRIQFHAGFTFQAATRIIPYLADLGISDVYASPIFQARKGSLHGYDMVNPNAINPELGSQADFESLLQECRDHKILWLQDVVPNHMAYHQENHFLMDVFENGKESRYFEFFDIDWQHPYRSLQNRVLAPFLGKHYGEALETQEIKLEYLEDKLAFRYYDLHFPLSAQSYREALGKDKAMLIDLYQKAPEEVRRLVRALNGTKGDPDSFNTIEKIHQMQHYRLAYWKVASEEINYRRFFNVNELISLRMEDEYVFNETHRLIFRLVREGKIQGLRVDHIDGLYNPGRYLKRLRDEAPGTYIVCEKILDFNEPLPSHWPVQGTTGYDFMNRVAQIFCQSRNERQFEKLYSRFTGLNVGFHQLSVEKKRLIIGEYMAGDVDGLAHLMKSISSRNRYGSDITLHGLRRAIVEVLCHFPVYRTYINQDTYSEFDRACVLKAIEEAKQSRPRHENELEFIRKALMFDFGYTLDEVERARWVHFIKRFQQVSSPVMAKGFEDTLLYVYNRLLSLNEVGGSPDIFGITPAQFHTYIKERKSHWPHALNATSTHDAKRGEDARARLNVLSEIPAEWRRQLNHWAHRNHSKRRTQTKGQIPDRNDEYFLYQCLIAHFPFDSSELPAFRERLKAYLVKAVREAKVHTAWLQPDASYEEGFVQFAEDVLSDEAFLTEFLPFQQRISRAGVINSLAQTLIKLTAPGVPDFYQGSELWDLNFVDPDNRRAVDFDLRQEYLRQIKELSGIEEVKRLFESSHDPRTKLFVIYKALQLRKTLPALFEAGDYIPIRPAGMRRANVFAFARFDSTDWSITATPRLIATLTGGEQFWRDTFFRLPRRAPVRWLNLFTGEEFQTDRNIAVGELFRNCPVALLIGR